MTLLITIPVPETSLQPVSPPILATSGFLSTLNMVEAEVKDITVSDDEASQTAANLLVRLTSAGKALDDQRLKLKRPYMDFIAAIDDAAREPKARIEEAKLLISTKNALYLRDKKIMAERRERERLAELKRLEAEAKKEQEAAAAAKSKLLDIGEDDEVAPTATEVRMAQLQAPVVASKPSGVREVVTLFPHIENVALLPDAFVERTAKVAAIRSTFCKGWDETKPMPVLAGVRFEVQRSVQSTGKVEF